MGLIFDERKKLNGKPGLHAFIAGVSYYHHLPGGDGPKAEVDHSFQQLTAAAKSAHRIAEWLINRRDHLPVPLATIRLLISPNKKTEGELLGIGSRCTRANFASEIKDWQKDAISKKHDKHYTFFYFAGHGAIRKKSDSILLLEDFGDPSDGDFAKAVALDNIFFGMSPPADRKQKMARTQFYFIDACSVLPKVLKRKQKPNLSDVFLVDLNGLDERSAPIFHASVPGAETFSIPGEQTIFSEALMNCLNGAAGKALPEEKNGDVRWQVSVLSLNDALKKQIILLNKKYGTKMKYAPRGYQMEAPIHTLDGPPEVTGLLHVIPRTAVHFISVNIIRNSERKSEIVWNLPRVKPHPYQGTLTAGSYILRTIADTPEPYQSPDKPIGVEPPNFELYARYFDDKA